MLRTDACAQGKAAKIDEYEVWRAGKDLQRLHYLFTVADQKPPPELGRLENWIQKIAASNDV